MPKYVMYDSDTDALVTTQTWDSYEEALKDLDDRLDNVIVVPLGIEEQVHDPRPRHVEFVIVRTDKTWDTVVCQVPRDLGHKHDDLIHWAEQNLIPLHDDAVAFAVYNSDAGEQKPQPEDPALRFRAGDLVTITKSTAEVEITNPPIRAKVLDVDDGSRGRLGYDYQLIEIDAHGGELGDTFEMDDSDIEGPATATQ
jgi:hypothetical protein